VIRRTQQFLWRLLALVALLLGVVGAFLPIMPTVPFVLLAAWAAGRGWPELEAWLLRHPRWGPRIRDWREHGAVSRRAKFFAVSAMAASGLLLVFLPVHPWIRAGVWLVLVIVAAWLWRRPES
jgi:uncharacterized protein